MIEENIIGLAVKGEIDPATTTLKPEHFSNFGYKKVWSVMLDMRARKMIPDLITLDSELSVVDPSVNWFAMLGSMADATVSSATSDGHIEIIKKNWVDREISTIGEEMRTAKDKDINLYIKKLMSINQTEKKYLHSFHQASSDAIDELEAVMQGERISIPTGLEKIDELTGGLHKSDLIIVAARSAMGKTAFLLNMAAANGNRPLIFSTEQSRVQAMWRMFSSMGSVHNCKMRQGNLSDYDFGMVSNAMRQIIDAKGFIYDKSGPYMSEIEATAREVMQNNGCSAIYLDYLQRIKHENPSLPKHEQVGDIAMRLKELARELDIPVVALAQVNRRVEQQVNKRPGMGDIKDSGTIEQEADSIMTLYRDEVYNEDSPDKGTCEVNFLKNRHGGNGMIRVKWDAPIMKFTDL